MRYFLAVTLVIFSFYPHLCRVCKCWNKDKDCICFSGKGEYRSPESGVRRLRHLRKPIH